MLSTVSAYWAQTRRAGHAETTIPCGGDHKLWEAKVLLAQGKKTPRRAGRSVLSSRRTTAGGKPRHVQLPQQVCELGGRVLGTGTWFAEQSSKKFAKG